MGRTAYLTAALFAACILLALAGTEPAGATLPGVNGRIAVSGSEIQTVRPDGTGVLRLTYNESYDYGPSWSPDGKRIAFVSSRGLNTNERGPCGEIWTMDADGSNPLKLTNVGRGRFCVKLGNPAFSPDGSRIAFTSNDGDIYTIDADGTNQMRITNNPSADNSPAWSPDGQRIAFSSNRFPGRDPDSGYTQNDYDILTINVDGTDVVRVTDSDLNETVPDWSPDGRDLVFVRERIDVSQYGNRDFSNDIFRAAADGSGRETQLTDDGHYEWEPIWSPDGARIAYQSTRKLKTMNADGTGQTTTPMPANGNIDWSPAPDAVRSPRPAFPTVEFAEGVPGYYGTDGTPGDIRSADLDGDGHADLVVGLPLPEKVAVFGGNGDGTFDAGVPYGSGLGGDVEIADLNGDAKKDLVVGESVLLGTGTGSFGQTTPYESGGEGSNVTVADFDGDGRQDIATTDGSNSTFPANRLLVVLGRGDGAFGPPSSFPLEGLPFDVDSADVDGDGDADLVGANQVFDTVTVLFNGGDGAFGKQRVFPAGTDPGEVELADFDGDGDQDIAVAHYDAMGASVLTGRGGGDFGTPVYYPTKAPKPTYLGVADVDGGGAPDLVVGNQDFGALSTLLNYGDGTFRSDRETATNTPTGSVYDAAISDFDEDGKPDVAYVGRIGPGFNVVLNRTGPARPTASDDSYASDEDATLNIPAPGVLEDDAGVAGRGGLVAVKATNPQRGALDLRPDGSFSYTPEADWAGTDTFTYKACHKNAPQECSEAVSVKIVHEPVNDPPTVDDRGFSTAEDTALTVGISDGLERDAREPEMSGMAVELVRDVPAGEGTLNRDGTFGSYGAFTFIPARDFTGAAAFDFRVCDVIGTPRACSEVRTATIEVTPVNDAPAAQRTSVSTPADAPREITLSATDAEGDDATFDVPQDAGPANGTLTAPSNVECADAAPKTCTAKVTYTPNEGYNGRDAFSYAASDGQARGEPAAVKIAVGQANDAPVANGDAYALDEDTKLTASVLGNDTDPENDPLEARVETAPGKGALELTPDGSFAYTPNPNFNGPDSFRYSVCDDGEPRLCSEPATASISVNPINDAPVARDTTVALNEDSTVQIDAFANDTDADGDALAMRYAVWAPRGNATCTAAGICTYTPNPDINGDDSFDYTVTDNKGGTATANVYLNVLPVPDAPVVKDDAYAMNEDSELKVSAPGVLANDTDADGSRLTATSNGGPRHGTLAFGSNGSFVYKPDADYNGNDSFTYAADDGRARSGPAIVSVTVNPVDEPEDLTPPDTSFSSGPSGSVSSRSASFGFSSTEGPGTFECSLDGAAYSTCSPPQSYSELDEGEHSFRVRAIDAAGNVDATPAERAWAVDTTRPTVGNTSPAGGSSTRDRTPIVRATITDSRTDLARDDVKLYLDGRRITGFSYDATTDRLRYAPPTRLSYGRHSATVEAQDAAGNVVAKIWSFRVVR